MEAEGQSEEDTSEVAKCSLHVAISSFGTPFTALQLAAHPAAAILEASTEQVCATDARLDQQRPGRILTLA